MRIVKSIVTAMMLGAATACVSMGPNYSTEAVAQLKPGMSKTEVIAIMGRPTSTTTLADGRQQIMWIHSRGTMLGSGQARSATLMFSAAGEYIATINQAETNIR